MEHASGKAAEDRFPSTEHRSLLLSKLNRRINYEF